MICIKAKARLCRIISGMEDRPEILRRRIALYRRYLKAGVGSDLAGHYLREIVGAESELERVTDEKAGPRPSN